MSGDGYNRLLGKLVDELIEAEARLRRVAARAPSTAGREDVLASADALSAERRRLRAAVARDQERRLARPSTPPVLRDRVEVGPLAIEPARREVTVDGGAVRLSNKEYELLRALAAEPTRVWTKAELLERVWEAEYGYGSSRTVDSHASRLRRKLNGAPDRHFVRNCWGVGYRLVDEVPGPAVR